MRGLHNYLFLMNKDSILKEQEDDIKIEEEKKHVSIVMEKEGGVE